MYTILIMDLLQSPTPIPYAGNAVAAGQASAAGSAGAATSSGEFRELLTMMMLSMTMNMGGQSGSGGMGMNASELFAPMMINLIEKLLASQMENETSPTPTPHGQPVNGHLTQEFHPGHNGLDYGVVVGTPVQATMDGKVVYAGWNDEGYGNLIIVENGPYRTYYAHLSEIPVSLGQTVQAGSVIGLSGNTGNSTGPHLHYEIRLNGQPVNPAEYAALIPQA